MPPLSGAVAIVTGGARGIGLAISRRLVVDGASIVVADLEGSKEAASELNAAGATALGVQVDVADEQSVSEMVRQATQKLGRLDVLVNNAGIFTSLAPTRFADLRVEDWRRVLDVNVIGVFNCCRAAVPAMSASGGGRIINIASAAPMKGLPMFLHYIASKGAVLAMTRSLAREVAEHRIRVNAVAPGFTVSAGVQEHPELLEALRAPSVQGRLIQRDETPDDVAGVVAFLAGPDSDFVTGQTVVVDGGSVLH
ncbi:MAG: SDR family NAD(P)-dependent oxidoreductase [Acidimicrobiia bacterium]